MSLSAVEDTERLQSDIMRVFHRTTENDRLFNGERNYTASFCGKLRNEKSYRILEAKILHYITEEKCERYRNNV